MSLLMVVELLVVLLALWVGARYGSLALGAISGIGLAILVFCFNLKPGDPPTDVIYIIIAAVTCAGMLQASGGMDWMIQIAERLLRRHPDRITFLAPFTTFFLTVLVGTGHVVYTLMPIICDIALKKGIRPERPCGIASIASQIGITCSPIAAAVVAFSTISAQFGFHVTNVQIIMVTPEFQAKIKDPEKRAYIYGSNATTLDKKISKESKRAVYIFLGALVLILVISIPQMFGVNILPHWNSIQAVDGAGDVVLSGRIQITAAQLAKAGVVLSGYTEVVQKYLTMNVVIQIIMLTATALMIIVSKAKPKAAVQGAVWQNGMVAVVAIYGIAWMSNTYFDNYLPQMEQMLGGIVGQYPWTIAIAFFLVSVLINSQGAVVVAMLPLAYSLHIEGWVLLGVLPSVYGYFFIPNYPSDIATVNFDRSGTTVIGKYLLNHSFMMPGMIHVVTATICGYTISALFHFVFHLY